ncbi:hypothetical protein OESDEN_07827, partial [Oesophagostomum dentatum]
LSSRITKFCEEAKANVTWALVRFYITLTIPFKRSRSKEGMPRPRPPIQFRHPEMTDAAMNERSRSKEGMPRPRPPIQFRHPEMTDAAMNENLGSIVLVKNRHKIGSKSAEGGSRDNAQQGAVDRMVSALGPPGPGSTTTSANGTTTPSTTTTTPLNLQPGADLPDAQPIPLAVQQAQALANPPGTLAPPQQPAMMQQAAMAPTVTSTTTPSTTTYGTTGATPGQTGTTDVSTTAPTTTTATATTTMTTTSSALSAAPAAPAAQPTAEKTDELTKKEVAEGGGGGGEKPGCDRLRKWKTYMEKTLDGGVESMVVGSPKQSFILPISHCILLYEEKSETRDISEMQTNVLFLGLSYVGQINPQLQRSTHYQLPFRV